jgi:hypothetical protein
MHSKNDAKMLVKWLNSVAKHELKQKIKTRERTALRQLRNMTTYRHYTRVTSSFAINPRRGLEKKMFSPEMRSKPTSALLL